MRVMLSRCPERENYVLLLLLLLLLHDLYSANFEDRVRGAFEPHLDCDGFLTVYNNFVVASEQLFVLFTNMLHN